MEKITVIENEELYQVLGQAVKFLPAPAIYLSPVLNPEIIRDSAVVIAGTGIFKTYADLKKGRGAKLIALCSPDEAMDNPEILSIKKPYKIMEIIEILNSIISKVALAGETVKIGNFIFDVSAGTLSKGGDKMSLTQKEADLILLLYRVGGEVNREELLREVWGYEADILTHTVETHIYRIRQKLGKEDDFIGSNAVGYFIK